jgi:hypothetical protein
MKYWELIADKGTVGSAWTAGCGLCREGWPLRWLRSRKDLHARETRHKKDCFGPLAFVSLSTPARP